MQRILLSLGMLVFAGAVVVGATGAFFSDTETSSGNTFSAGAIDLGIDNTSYYNGISSPDTSWLLTYDLDEAPHLFFDFHDLKPGDWGEDTISLHVKNNPSWLCADVTLTSDEENDITEPESDLNDTGPDGELADEVNFIWWADDGDNVLESDEVLLQPSGNLGQVGVGATTTVTIADSQNNIFTGLVDDPLISTDEGGDVVHYIGKAWCFGDLQTNPVPAGQGEDPTVASGIICNGVNGTNITQTDSMTLDIAFRAEQARNNENFTCRLSSSD